MGGNYGNYERGRGTPGAWGGTRGGGAHRHEVRSNARAKRSEQSRSLQSVTQTHLVDWIVTSLFSIVEPADSDNHTVAQSQLLYTITITVYTITQLLYTIAPRTNPQSQAVCKMCKMDQPAQGVPSMHGSTKHVWGCADGQDDATTANGTQTKKESQSFYVIMSPWRSTLCMETLITIKPKSRTYTARPRGAGVRPRGGRWS